MFAHRMWKMSDKEIEVMMKVAYRHIRYVDRPMRAPTIMALVDPDRRRATLQILQKIVRQCGLSHDTRSKHAKLFKCYATFLCLYTRLKLNMTWKAVAQLMDRYNVGTLCPSSWHDRCTKWLRVFVKYNRLLEPMERLCLANEENRFYRPIFKNFTMMVDSVPTFCNGRQTGRYTVNKAHALVSTTVVCCSDGWPLLVDSGGRPQGDGEKLELLMKNWAYNVPHFEWETMLGDQAYSAQCHCTTPVAKLKEATAARIAKDADYSIKMEGAVQHLSPAQQNYNDHLAYYRSAIECFFGRMRANWRFIRSTEDHLEFISMSMVFAVSLEKFVNVGMRPVPPEIVEKLAYSTGVCYCNFGKFSANERKKHAAAATRQLKAVNPSVLLK